MPERGEITSRDFASQIRDFRGLRFGTITPTDIDGFVEFDDRVFVLMESKFGDAELPRGQELALERLCDCCCDAGKKAALLILRHDVMPKSGSDIDFASLPVVRFRYEKKWRTPSAPITARQAVTRLLGRPDELVPIAKPETQKALRQTFDVIMNGEEPF